MRQKIAFLVTIALTVSLFPLWAQEEKSEYSIKEYLEQALPLQEGRKVVLNEAVGLLTITDTPSNHKKIRELLGLIDVGPRQINIEARFVELTLKDLNELGVEWAGVYNESIKAPGQKVKGIDGAVQTYFGAGDKVSAGMGFWISKAYLSGSQLWAYLRALEQTGQANMLSSPRLTTLSGQPANIQIIRRIPYADDVEIEEVDPAMLNPNPPPTWISLIATYTIVERIVGINLEVTPTVGEETDIINLEIHPVISEKVNELYIHSHVPNDLARPVIDTRSIQTSVIVKNGETVVMGGLIKDDDRQTVKKVPLSGNIPLIGKLFRYKFVEKEKKNLVIFITATLVSAEGEEIL